ncbi:PREDICTED: sugar transporter ERD6-like 15 isoform X2 [Tarenaya hassleriana]|uniref:sugar transporter ERD6-like 15 isoform X2 n=1 Tax=Tarenaya hassleriana TaxID=28532 RepID=UPI00053C2FAF|nr:PREDICTED: sugar transporter ERD6-like 15 isoform X2 [Tarenaya hassleriana]
MADEGLLRRTDSAAPKSSLLSEISNVATRDYAIGFSSCAGSAFVFGCIIGYSAPTQSGIMKDLNLSIADQYSFFGSVLTVGQIIGAFMSGKLADLVGRVYTMWIVNILYIIGWLGIAFAKEAWLLDLGRFLHGFTIGIGSYLGPIYIAEITPRNLRGSASSLSQLFAGIGISTVYALGTVFSWRSLALMGSVPCLMTLPLLFFVPESPRWLAKMGRQKEFEAVLLHLRGAKADFSDEAADILENTEFVREHPDVCFSKLFQRKYAFSLMSKNHADWSCCDSIATTPRGQWFYVLHRLDFRLCRHIQRCWFPNIVSCPVVDRGIRYFAGGRIWAAFSSSCKVSQGGAFLGCLVIAISFFLQERHIWETGTPILTLASVLVYIGSYAIGMGSIPWIIASEIYAMDVKGAAGTICNIVSAISSWIVAYFFSFLLQWSSTGTFLIFASVCGFGVVFTAKLVPETKGKSLEEIQSLLSSPSH